MFGTGDGGRIVTTVVGAGCIFELKVGNSRSFVHARRDSTRGGSAVCAYLLLRLCRAPGARFPHHRMAGVLLPVQLPSLSAIMRRTNMTFKFPCNICRRRLAGECTALLVSASAIFTGNTATLKLCISQHTSDSVSLLKCHVFWKLR
jgi:hypothetical protein